VRISTANSVVSRHAAALRIVVLLAVALGAAAPARGYLFTRIVDTNSGTFDPSGLDIPSLNDAGQVAFRAIDLNFVSGIYRGAGGPLTTIVDNAGSLTTLGRLPSINNSGEVSFAAGISGGTERIFRGNGGPLTTIASTKGLHKFFAFNTQVNNVGSVAFQGELDTFDEGLFHGNGGPLVTTVFLTSTSPFDDSFGSPAINDAGQIAFEAGRDVGDRGIFRYEPATNTFTTIVTDTGTFSTPSERPSINASGRVAFHSLTNGGTSEGIFVGDGTTIVTVADDSGAFRFFDIPSLNDAGQVAFTAELDDLSDGLFDGPDPVNDRVLMRGQAFDGGVIANVAFDREGLNNLGQLAFLVQFEGERSAIYVATPVPEPVAGVVAIAGLVMLGRRARRVR